MACIQILICKAQCGRCPLNLCSPVLPTKAQAEQRQITLTVLRGPLGNWERYLIHTVGDEHGLLIEYMNACLCE